MSPLFFFVPYSLPYLRKESEKNPLFHPLFFLHILIPFFHDIHTVFLHMQNCPPYVDKVVDNFLFFLFSFPGLLVPILQFLLKIGLFHTTSALFSFIPSFPYYVDNFFFNLFFILLFYPLSTFPCRKPTIFFYGFSKLYPNVFGTCPQSYPLFPHSYQHPVSKILLDTRL